MRRLSLFASVVAVGFLLMIIGCAKEPTQELAAATAAVDAAKAAQADKYAAVDFAAAQDSLNAAVAEIGKQKAASALSRNYTRAKRELVAVVAIAGPLKVKAAEEMAKAQANADNAIAKLSSSIADAKAMLAKMPKNKKAKAAVEKKKKDILVVESSMAEIQQLKASGDFVAAADKANAAAAKLESTKAESKPAPVEKPAKKAKSKKRR